MAQAAAALRDFGPAYERYGSFRLATEASQSPPLSAVPPTAAIGEKPTPRSRARAGPWRAWRPACGSLWTKPAHL